MFNRLVGRQSALVYNTPGSHVTRDYKEGVARLSDLTFKLIDTSGLEPFMSESTVQGRATAITRQVLSRVAASMFLIDARSGVTAHDHDVAKWLQRHHPQPIVLVAAKCDHYGDTQLLANAYEAAVLGLGDVVPYSAETRAGTTDLYDALMPLVDTHTAAMHPEGGRPLDGDEGSAPLATHKAGAKAPRARSSRRPFAGWQPPSSPAPLRREALDTAHEPGVGAPPPPAHASDSPLWQTPLPGLPSKGGGQGPSSSGAAVEYQSALAPSTLPSEDVPLAEEQQSLEGEDEDEGGNAVRSAAAATADSAAKLGIDTPIKLTIAGLPNVGKSSLLNQLLGYERAVTGPEPGLTRDAVSEAVEWRGWKLEVTDTAGWMRGSTFEQYDDVGGKVANLTMQQGTARVNFSHAVLLLLDGEEAAARLRLSGADGGMVMSRRELSLAGRVLEEGRLLVVAPNKMDTLSQQGRHQLLSALVKQTATSLGSWQDCITILPLSGASGRGLEAILARIVDLTPKWSAWITTAQLNHWLRKMASALDGGGMQPITSVRFLKMRSTRPPTILAEFRGKLSNAMFPAAIGRAIRDSFGLHGVPVRIVPVVKVRKPDARARRVFARKKAAAQAASREKRVAVRLHKRLEATKPKGRSGHPSRRSGREAAKVLGAVAQTGVEKVARARGRGERGGDRGGGRAQQRRSSPPR